MRLSLFGVLVALVISTSASNDGELSEPEIAITASFPETNAFGHVVNGEKNLLTLSVENKSDRNVTVVSVAGSVHEPRTNHLVKNLTAMRYGIPLVEGVKIQLPFMFYSEFKPGDLRLNVWLEHSSHDIAYRVSAYDSIVTVVEPEVSIFDLKLITTYLMVTAIFGGLLYIAYLNFVPQSKKSRSKRSVSSTTSTPVASTTATSAGGYQEEWIPEHHLKKSKSGKKASGFASGTSGDELEASGAEGRKRKGKK